MPVPLAPIVCGTGDALLSVTINVEKASNLREAATQSDWGWVGIVSGRGVRLEWSGGFGLFYHPVGGRLQDDSVIFRVSLGLDWGGGDPARSPHPST